MKEFDRQEAMLLARTAREAVDFHRWMPDQAEKGALLDLERALSITLQAGQTELERRNAIHISNCANTLHAVATAAYRSGRIADPTLVDEQVFKSDRTRVLDVIDVRRRPAEIVDMSQLRTASTDVVRHAA